MVAKAKGDIFDINVGGVGFHMTSHLIALAALVIACFAIAGYIHFRGDSIPASALKDETETLTKQGETWRFEKTYTTTTGDLVTAAGNVVLVTGLVLPADAIVVGARTSTITASGTITAAGVGQSFDLVSANRDTTVGNAIDADADDIITGVDLGNVSNKTTLAGIVALDQVKEIYIANTGAAITTVADPDTAKISISVQWIGSAPISYKN